MTAIHPMITCSVPVTMVSALYATVSFYPKELDIETMFSISQTKKLRFREVR